MKVYKSPNQFSFVIRNRNHYYYFYTDDGKCWNMEKSGAPWGETSISLDAEKSSWIELLILTGKTRGSIERMIRNLDRSWKRYLKTKEIQSEEMIQRLRKFKALEAQRQRWSE